MVIYSDNTTQNASGVDIEYDNFICQNIPWELFIIEGIATTAICLPGVLVNLVSIIVLCRPSMKSTFNFVLALLIIMDTIYLQEPLFMRGIRYIFAHYCIARKYYLFFVPLLNPYLFALVITARVASIYLMVLASLERCAAIYFPFKQPIWFSWRRSKQFSLSVIVFSIVYNIPVWFETTAKEKSISGVFVGYTWEDTHLLSNETYVFYYVNLGSLLVMRLIPFAALLITNLTTFKAVRKMNQRRRAMTQTQAQEISVTNVLFMIVLLFLVSNVFTIIMHVYEAFTPPPPELLTSTSNFLSGLSSATNALLYCFMSSKFKKELKNVIFFW